MALTPVMELEREKVGSWLRPMSEELWAITDSYKCHYCDKVERAREEALQQSDLKRKPWA